MVEINRFKSTFSYSISSQFKQSIQMKTTFLLFLISFILLISCTTVKQIGDINMVSCRNIENNMNYVLLRSYMGGSKKESKRSAKLEIVSIQDAVNKVVKETPGGEFLKNVKIYLVDSKYISVDRKSTRLNSSHLDLSRMPSSA